MNSDDEQEDWGGRMSDDVALPKATVNKFSNDIAAAVDMRLSAEVRELLAQCCTEFVQMISSQANEICEKDSRKTITPEHILRALRELGLEEYHDQLYEAYEQYRGDEKASKRNRNADKSGLSREEMLRQQRELFEMARNDPLLASQHAAAVEHSKDCGNSSRSGKS
ncbi:Negative cofactor 2 complex subunit beta [Porphyridium purpureum]|uniref:Negative cofactor 2 complex subunit beta n=1 Tax=Porphyridium purpureum TaxID=35688 RepID=A0A5J4YV23_PORPP|nr:Negative cofactor 2 complex subunit beta [Porphyridium purpureum]|eukprot:POR1797..scf209_3